MDLSVSHKVGPWSNKEFRVCGPEKLRGTVCVRESKPGQMEQSKLSKFLTWDHNLSTRCATVRSFFEDTVLSV